MKKPRMSKFGQLINKMLDSEENWIIYDTTYEKGLYIRYIPLTYVYLKLDTQEEFELTYANCFTQADKELIYPKALALYTKLLKGKKPKIPFDAAERQRN